MFPVSNSSLQLGICIQFLYPQGKNASTRVKRRSQLTIGHLKTAEWKRGLGRLTLGPQASRASNIISSGSTRHPASDIPYHLQYTTSKRGPAAPALPVEAAAAEYEGHNPTNYSPPILPRKWHTIITTHQQDYMYSNILKYFGINTPPSQWHTTTITTHRQQ